MSGSLTVHVSPILERYQPFVPSGTAGVTAAWITGPVVSWGTTAADGTEAAPVPATFVAVTVKVYVSPSVSPLTVMGLAVPVPV